MSHIIKRAGHNEPYDVRKLSAVEALGLYASIYAACLSVREQPGAAELVAEEVCKDVETWLSRKHEVTSNDIRLQAARYLNDINSDAGYMYMHHRIMW